MGGFCHGGGGGHRSAGAARALFEAVIAPAAEMEQYMVSFETVLGSAAQAAAYMQQLTDYANSTPFEISELASIYGKVGSVGFETESVNQLASRGLNVRAIWAKRNGISEAEVQKNISAKNTDQTRGAAQPGMAYYLPLGVDFEESGQTYTDAWNEPGLVQGIACVPRQHAPTIVEGGIRLPFAQTMWKEEDSGVTPHP